MSFAVARYLVTLSVGRPLLTSVKESFLAASQKWGAELIVIREPLNTQWKEISPHKLLLNDVLRGELKEIVYCDSDVLIRSDCPSPFSLMPRSETIGRPWIIGIRDEQYLNRREEFSRSAVAAYAQATGHNYTVNFESFINGGFLAWRYPQARSIFAIAKALVDDADGCNIDCWEQAALNIAIYESGAIPIVLPPTFNRIGAIHDAQQDTLMRDFIYHSAGRPYGSLLDNIEWSNPAAGGFARILPWAAYGVWWALWKLSRRCVSVDLRAEVVRSWCYRNLLRAKRAPHSIKKAFLSTLKKLKVAMSPRNHLSKRL